MRKGNDFIFGNKSSMDKMYMKYKSMADTPCKNIWFSTFWLISMTIHTGSQMTYDTIIEYYNSLEAYSHDEVPVAGDKFM